MQDWGIVALLRRQMVTEYRAGLAMELRIVPPSDQIHAKPNLTTEQPAVLENAAR